MGKEIERKFFAKSLPNLAWIEPISYERYFLFRNDKSEIRIQNKWGKYEFERKEKKGNLSANKQKFEITKDEFEQLKKYSKQSIIRDAYLISKNPEISIKIYHWEFEWLVRVEIEFENEDLAKKFIPLDWFWEEITNSQLWKDSKLLDLKEEEFKKLIN